MTKLKAIWNILFHDYVIAITWSPNTDIHLNAQFDKSETVNGGFLKDVTTAIYKQEYLEKEA